jgi:AbrB family looped-hinge helix DNA binding protein
MDLYYLEVKMLVSRISSKGQITIPKKVRESLRANPGDFVEYEVQGNVVLLRRAGPFRPGVS